VDLPQYQMLEAAGLVSIVALAVRIHTLFCSVFYPHPLHFQTQMLVHDKVNIQAKSLVMALTS